MKRLTPFLGAILGALLLTTGTALAELPFSIEIEPPQESVAGSPITIGVRASGLDDAVPVVLRYRTASAATYQQLALAKSGADLWSGTIPATNDLGVRYYVEVGTAKGPSITLGSAKAPFRLELATPAGSPASASWFLPTIAVGVALTLVAVMLGLRLLERRRRLASVDDAFWFNTLQSFVGQPSHVVSPRLHKLALTPLDHPISGRTKFPYAVFIQKLGQLAGRAGAGSGSNAVHT